MNDNRIQNLNNLNLKFTAIQCSYMMSFCVIIAFSILILHSRNFNNFEIGIILASQTISSGFSQTFLGNFADNHPEIPLKNIILFILIISFIANIFLFFAPSNFFITICIFILIGLTEYSGTSFINSLAIQFVNIGIPINFGLARGLGSFAFGLAAFFLGKFYNLYGADSIIIIHGCFLILTIISVYIFDKPILKGESLNLSNKKIDTTSIFDMIFKNKKFLTLLVSSIFIFTSHGMLANFLSKIITHLGGTSSDYGKAILIGALSEVPTMVCFKFFLKKISTGKLVCISFFFFFLKSLCFMFVGNVTIVMVLQIFQLLGFGLFLPSSVYYVNEIVSNEQAIKGQTLFIVASLGLGITTGNFFGGLILNTYGVSSMILVSTLSSFVGFLILFISIKNNPASKKN